LTPGGLEIVSPLVHVDKFPGLTSCPPPEADSVAGRYPPVLFALFLVVFTISCDGGHSSQKPEPKRQGLQTVTIDNTVPRRDVTGQIIDAHDGCLQLFGTRFYLYGTAYGTNAGYSTANRFRVYRSPDLEQWALAGELFQEHPAGVYYRPSVVFNPKTHKYVLWYNWYPKQWDGQTGVAISDSPVGPFTIVNPDVRLSCSRAGDGSLFVDDDGTGYYIYTAIDKGYAVRVERLTPDYLGATGEISSVLAVGAEAPLLFRRNNLYYALCGPRCAFCPEGSEVLVFISISPLGPFGRAPDINRRPESGAATVWTQKTFAVDIPGGTFVLTNELTYQNNAPIISAQETWVAKIPMSGEPAFVWMADRWQSAPDGIKGHDLQFWSSPLKFNSYDDTILPMENLPRWDITWSWGD
jgi:hypothetical protein